MFRLKLSYPFKMRILFCVLSLVCHPAIVLGASHQSTDLLRQSKQLLLVRTASPKAVQGKLYLYQRASTKKPWVRVGAAIDVVVGRRGMSDAKREGDGRSPAGVFKLGPAFGFTSRSKKSFYLPITANTVCVDDPRSAHYGQIVDESRVQKDWRSAEQMRQIKLYRHGLVIGYNAQTRSPTKGSCVFMHIWRTPKTGTAGCTAMSEISMKRVLNWLNFSDHPVLIQRFHR